MPWEWQPRLMHIAKKLGIALFLRLMKKRGGFFGKGSQNSGS